MLSKLGFDHLDGGDRTNERFADSGARSLIVVGEKALRSAQPC
jgi:hypothetical protein